MLKLGRVTKVKVFFLVLVYVFNIDLLEFSAAILDWERAGLLQRSVKFSSLNIGLIVSFILQSSMENAKKE